MVWQTESATNAAHGGQCLAPCIVMFEKVGPASEWPLKKKRWPGHGSIQSVWAHTLTLGRTDNVPTMFNGPGSQFLDVRVVFNDLKSN